MEPKPFPLLPPPPPAPPFRHYVDHGKSTYKKSPLFQPAAFFLLLFFFLSPPFFLSHFIFLFSLFSFLFSFHSRHVGHYGRKNPCVFFVVIFINLERCYKSCAEDRRRNTRACALALTRKTSAHPDVHTHKLAKIGKDMVLFILLMDTCIHIHTSSHT